MKNRAEPKRGVVETEDVAGSLTHIAEDYPFGEELLRRASQCMYDGGPHHYAKVSNSLVAELRRCKEAHDDGDTSIKIDIPINVFSALVSLAYVGKEICWWAVCHHLLVHAEDDIARAFAEATQNTMRSKGKAGIVVALIAMSERIKASAND